MERRKSVSVFQNGTGAKAAGGQAGKRLSRIELIAFAVVALAAVSAWGVFLVWLLLRLSGLA